VGKLKRGEREVHESEKRAVRYSPEEGKGVWWASVVGSYIPRERGPTNLGRKGKGRKKNLPFHLAKKRRGNEVEHMLVAKKRGKRIAKHPASCQWQVYKRLPPQEGKVEKALNWCRGQSRLNNKKRNAPSVVKAT